MARVLLTGASGFVGAAILRRLIAEGHRVVTLGRAPEAPIAGPSTIASTLSRRLRRRCVY